RRLLASVKLLEPAAFLPPVTRLAFLNDEQDRQAQRERESRNALRVEEAQDHHALSASIDAPSRLAETLKRPTGPPASRPTMTTIIARMMPPRDQPKMATIVCSSEQLQPPHMRSATMNPAQAPRNL